MDVFLGLANISCWLRLPLFLLFDGHHDINYGDNIIIITVSSNNEEDDENNNNNNNNNNSNNNIKSQWQWQMQ